jgi:hypothetical protein
MDDVEYILRIVLKARDEMAKVLAKARTEIRGFAKDADKMNTSVTNLNQAMKNFDKGMEGITKKLEGWRAVLRDAGDDSKSSTKSLEGFTEASKRNVAATQKAVQSQKQLQQQAALLRQDILKLKKAREEETVTADFAVAKYKQIAKALEETSLKMSDASRRRSPAHVWADQARDAADAIEDVNKEIAADLKASEKAAKDHQDKLAGIEKQRVANVKLSNAAISREIDQQIADELAKSKDAAKEKDRILADAERRRVAMVKLSNAQISREIDQQIQEEARAAKAKADILTRRASQERERNRLAKESARIDRGEASDADVKRAIADYSKLANAYRGGSARAREFGNEAERLRLTIRKTSNDANRGEGAFNRLSKAFRNSGSSAAGFDNQLRGIGIFAAVASAQQLISAAIALGGELVSLAGSAAMAGGALGGALAAGAAQALPVFGLLAGAMQRVTSVIDAVGQAQKLQQAQFTDAEKGGAKAIDQANTLANAHDTVAEATDRLAESRANLTKAQKEGTDQLADLITAEKQAALAAKGAALDVKSAQKALADAIRTGADQLEIDQKRQALEEARASQRGAKTTLRRATRDRVAAGGDVNNLEPVKDAAKAVEDAEKAVTKANRGLDQAEDKTNRVASSTMTAAANLDFLLSQLSPAERRLYDASTRLYESYKKIFQGTGTGGSGIYGVIIDAFTRAVEQVEKIMEMPKVISALTKLAGVIGDNIDKVVATVADPAVLNQLIGLIDAASENLGPVVDIVLDLGKAFLNIAETANPALQDLLAFIGPIVDKFLAMTADKDKMEDFFNTGEDHLESWINLVLAVIRLFAILFGASMDDGKKSIDDLTEKINSYSDGLEKNIGKVKKFFGDARKAAYDLGGVVENLGKVLFASFDAERVGHLTDIINKSLIPAIAEVTDVTGKAVEILAKFVDTPLGAEIVKWLIVFGLLGKVASGVVGIFGKVFGAVEKIVDVAKILKLDKLILGIGRLTGATEALSGAFGAMRVAGMAAFGPWGLAIAALVIGIGLLLNHFGMLDDVWNAIKETASAFMESLSGPLNDLQEAFGSVGIKVGKLEDVVKVLNFIGHQLATFISTYLIGSIKGLGKILEGIASVVIRVFTGVINLIHGYWDLLIGIFTGDTDQIKRGLKRMVKGIGEIFYGVIDGIGKVLVGLTEVILAPFKAAWKAVKEFFKVSSPSKLAENLGKNIIEGFKDGFVGLVKWITSPWRRAWRAVNDFFDGKPQKLAEKVIDEFVDRLKVLWRRVRNAASYLWEHFKDGWEASKHFATEVINSIVDGLMGLPAALLKAVENIKDDLINVGKSIGHKVAEGIRSVVGGIKGLFGGGDDDKKDDKKQAPNAPPPAPTVNFDIGVGAIPFGAKDLDAAEKLYDKFWKDLRNVAKSSTEFIQRQFREMRVATSQSSDKMYKDIRGSVADIQTSFTVRGNLVVKSWSDTWQSLKKVTYEGLDYIGHETNRALTAMGEKHIAFGLTAPTKKDGKAIGGWIGNQGERGRDGGLYPLGRGEAVLNFAHQPYVETALNATYGFGLGGLFSHVKGFHAGGPGQAGFAGGGFPSFGTHPTNVIPGIAKLIEILQKHFPLLQVTSTTDHGLMTTSGNVSDHTTGHAVDLAGTIPYMAKVVSFINSSGMWKMLKQGIHNPGLAVNRGQRVDSPGFFTAAWPQHVDHIHLALLGALGKITDGFADVARRLVTPHGAAGSRLVQKILDRVLKAGNAKLSAAGGDAESYGATKSVGAGAANIFKFFKTHGFSDEQAAGWIGNLTQESGLNPGIVQPNGEGHGLAQWGHGRFDALVSFAKSRNKPWQDLATQLDFILKELAGPESAASAAIHAAKTVQQAVDAIGLKYERFGVAGNRSGPAEAAYKRFKGKYAEGGIVDGPDGAPTPILAHAGEWVLNAGQQVRAAMLSGLSVPALRSMLGFGGGPSAFAKGGVVNKRLASIQKLRAADVSDDVYQNVAQSLDDLHDLAVSLRQVGKLVPKRVRPILDLIELATQEGGMLDNLRASIERSFATTALRLRKAQLSVGAGRVVTQRDNNDVLTAQESRDALRKQRGTLTEERGDIANMLGKVTTAQKRKGLSKKAMEDLAAREVELRNRLAEANERVMQNEEDIYAAQEALAEARKAAMQEIVDKVKDKYTKLTAQTDRAKRVATVLGVGMDAVNNTIQANMSANLAELQGALNTANARGQTEIADGLRDDIAELQTSILEFAQQRIQDTIDAVNKTASRRMGQLDLIGRMANAIGWVSDQTGVNVGGETLSRADVFGQRAAALRQQQSGLQGALGQVGGDTQMAKDLTDQIAELDVAIAENTRAQFDAQVQQVTSAHDYTQSMLDLNMQLNDLTNATDDAARIAGQTNLLTQKQNDLNAKAIELQGLLAQTQPGTQQYQDLQKAILENKVALAQNTKALGDLTGEGSTPVTFTSTAWQWYRSAMLNGTGGLLPQYTPPNNASFTSDIFGGGGATSSTTNNGSTYVTQIEVNEAGQPVDPTKIASAVVFAQSTAQ